MEQLTAGFLIDGPMPALVETGSQSSVPAVHAALDALGLGPLDLRWIIVTHIHLDHAGGVGELAHDFPNATVVVHERGARHLVDPSRLVDSASRVYGPLLDSLYGRMTAVPEDRLIAAGDGFRVDVGNGRSLAARRFPGARQAPPRGPRRAHRHACSSVTPWACCCPTSACSVRPRRRPTSTSSRRCTACERFAELRPEHMVLTHYGPVADAQATLAEAEDMLHGWVEVAERVIEDAADAGIDDVAAALAEAFALDPETLPEGIREKAEILNGVHSNAAGIVRYLRQRAAAPAE